MIDNDGYRPNVGIIICNKYGQVLWARRHSQNSWQFPQGGIKQNESPEQAMYRELYEEVGLRPQDVKVLMVTNGWLRYKLPKRMVRWENAPVCIGQKQKWFLLQLLSNDNAVKLDTNPLPEFDDWRWVSYWYPIRQVIAFKREVYRKAMKEFAAQVFAIQQQELANSSVDHIKPFPRNSARPANRNKRRVHYYQAKRQPKKA